MHHSISRRLLATALLTIITVRAQEPDGHVTQNVVLVTLDGLRWQEVFYGADNRMMNKEHGGVADLLATRRRFWRGTPEARREVLMPFLWSVVTEEGQLFGDPERGSRAVVTNPHRFSYPGYSELLCGHVDASIDSNRKFPNPNETVLEWLHTLPAFAGGIAAFASWDVHPFILNEERSGIFVEAAWDPVTVAASPQRMRELQQQFDLLPRYWESVAWDAPTFARAMEYVEHKHPRILYLALGETDEWAHARRYDLYLQMANRADSMLRELWETLQQDEHYRGKTTMLVTVDHGRGRTERNWTDHGADVDGADEVWMAVLGPDTPALGIRENTPATQAMVAATVAAMLEKDWPARQAKAAAALPGVVR
jgi:hypothetical protein